MAAPDSSCSSTNQTVEGPSLSGIIGRQTETLEVYKSFNLVADGRYDPQAGSREPFPTGLNIASRFLKNRSALPKNDASHSIIQSSWIQRLRSPSLRSIVKDDQSNFLKKESFVCTHFTKDYSSCNRHVENVSHHVRSSSWPLLGNLSNAAKFAPDVDVPAHGQAEERDDMAAICHTFKHPEDFKISKSTSQTNIVGSHWNDRKPFPTLDNIGLHAELPPLNEYFSITGMLSGLQDMDDRDCKKRLVQFTEYYDDCLKDQREVEFFSTSQQRNPWERFEKSNARGHLGGCLSPLIDVVNASTSPLSRIEAGYSSGASADADVNNCKAKPVDFGSFDAIVAEQVDLGKSNFAVKCPELYVLRDFGHSGKSCQLLGSEKEAVQNVIFRKCEGSLKFGESTQGIISSRGPAGTSFLQDAKWPSDHLDQTHLRYLRAGACTGSELSACGDGLDKVRTLEGKSQNVVVKMSDALRVGKNLAKAQNSQSGEVGGTNTLRRSFKSVHEKATRTRIREKSLGDYWSSWCNVLEEPTLCEGLKMEYPQIRSEKAHAAHCNHRNYISQVPSKAKLGVGDLSSTKFRLDWVSSAKEPYIEVSQEQILAHHEGGPDGESSQSSYHNAGSKGRLLNDGYDHSRKLSIHPNPNLNCGVTGRKGLSRSPGDLASLEKGTEKHSPLNAMENKRSTHMSTSQLGWLRRWRSLERCSD